MSLIYWTRKLADDTAANELLMKMDMTCPHASMQVACKVGSYAVKNEKYVIYFILSVVPVGTKRSPRHLV